MFQTESTPADAQYRLNRSGLGLMLTAVERHVAQVRHLMEHPPLEQAGIGIKSDCADKAVTIGDDLFHR